MRGNEFLDNMELVDTAYVEAADATPKKKTWIKWTAVAACFALLIVAGAAIFPSLFGRGVVNPGITTEALAVIWPWEYMTIYEQYTDVTIDGVAYRGKGRPVSDALVGDSIGTRTVIGFDGTTNKRYSAEFEVFMLQDVNVNYLIAVKMDGIYYVFMRNDYTPPSDLATFLYAVDLPKVLELGHFSENGDSPNKNHFSLTSDDYIWEVLMDCGNAAFVEDQEWKATGRDYLSFTVTSEVLGVYKKAMYVTSDGYLWTNAFDYRYLFNIGEEAAAKIIQYAKENSVKADYEPFRNSVAGKVTQITDDYILIDDSALFGSATYKVMLDDLRISRYVELGYVKVGDTVQIEFEGEIDKHNGNIIRGAVSASRVVISNGDVGVPE